jgi:hypothetical protein
MNAPVPTSLSRRERRLGRRLGARDEQPLFEALLAFRGRPLSERFALSPLFAVGGEGAIFEVRDNTDANARLVAKLGRAPWHRPIELTSKRIRQNRAIIVDEEALLRTAGSPFLPRSEGLFHMQNPHLEAARGGAFAEAEPCLVMERLGGQDLDAWLCRVHRGAAAWIPCRRFRPSHLPRFSSAVRARPTTSSSTRTESNYSGLASSESVPACRNMDGA